MHGFRDALCRQGQPRSATRSPERTLLQPQAERQPLTIARFAHGLLTVCSLGSSWRLPLLLKRLKVAKSKATMLQKGRSQQSAFPRSRAGRQRLNAPQTPLCGDRSGSASTERSLQLERGCRTGSSGGLCSRALWQSPDWRGKSSSLAGAPGPTATGGAGLPGEARANSARHPTR